MIPSRACAWAITKMPAAVASSTSTSSSAGRKWAWRGSSRGERTPPLVATLITSAPIRCSSRTLRRISSGPSTMPDGMPGVTGVRGAWTPDTSQSSLWPPVWLTIVRLSWIREPGKSPSSRACLTPRSAPAASRTNVTPPRSVRPRFRAASK